MDKLKLWEVKRDLLNVLPIAHGRAGMQAHVFIQLSPQPCGQHNQFYYSCLRVRSCNLQWDCQS